MDLIKIPGLSVTVMYLVKIPGKPGILLDLVKVTDFSGFVLDLVKIPGWPGIFTKSITFFSSITSSSTGMELILFSVTFHQKKYLVHFFLIFIRSITGPGKHWL